MLFRSVPEVEAGGSNARGIAAVAEHLAGRNLEMLQGRIPDLAIPVRLQQNLSIDGLGDGPVQVDPGELPVRAAVARVLPLSGRLWVFLDVKIGPWRERAVAAPSAPLSGPSTPPSLPTPSPGKSG